MAHTGSGTTRSPGKEARDFLLAYRRGIAALPEFSGPPERYLASLSPEERNIFMTLLPAGAALLKRRGEQGTGPLLSALRERCIKEIDRVVDCT
jgi:hypothetical protein